MHLGSMPDAVAAVVGEPQRPGTVVDPQRPVRGRDASARHHADHARHRRRRASPASSPAARTTPTSAARRRARCRPTRARLEDEGVVISPRPLEPLDDLEDLIVPHAKPRAAASRPARAAAPRTRPGARLLEELVAGRAAERDTRRDGRDPRLRRAADAGAAWPSCPTAAGRRDDVLEGGPEGAEDIPLRGPRHDRRRRARARLLRQLGAGRGQPELPASGDPLGGALRGPGAARSRRPAVGRRAPAGAGRSRPRARS